jgi:general secretion pathway protein D
MKRATFIILATIALAAWIEAADGPTNAPAGADATAAVAVPDQPATEPPKDASPAPAEATPSAASSAATKSSASDTNLIVMNFHGARLEQVLTHLSEAAGMIINVRPGATLRGTVDAWSSKPVTREEAVELVETALNENGLTGIQTGRTLTIVNKLDAPTSHIPVISESDPDKIPMSDRIVTQIIPVRFVEAGQLIKDISELVPSKTPLTANEAGNSVIITDTQANIHKVAEIIRAIDMGAEDFVVVKVFHLTNASPVETAQMLSDLFPDESKQGQGQSQSPFMGRLGRFFGGGGGPFGGGGGPGGGGNSASNNQNQRIKKRNRVIAVADQRTTSVIVSANRDLMDQIESVVEELDADPHGKPQVAVFTPSRIPPEELQPVLMEIFGAQNQQNRNNNQQNQTDLLVNRVNTQSSQTSSSSSSGNRSMGNIGTRGGGSGFGAGP